MMKKCAAVLAGLALAVAATAPAMAATQEEADALAAAEDWDGASAAYRALVDEDDSDAANWFNLANALHQLEDYEAARDAYQKAIDAGYAPAGRAHFRIARIYMSLGDEDAALAEIDKLVELGGPYGRFMTTTAEFEPLSENPRFIAAVKALTPCTDDEYRHFDFWLGEWDVTAAGAPQPTAHSRISSKHGGCAVLEEYEVIGGGYTGMSINFYDNVRKVWHQSWMANGGVPVYLEGGLNDDGAMVLSDETLPISEATGTINRVTWSKNEDGSVRQFWETSTDKGETWTTAFDGHYAPKAGD